MKLVMLAMILVLSLGISAQVRTFKWDTEMCSFSGTYDASKYTEAQLRNTSKLFKGEYKLTIYSAVFKYEDIGELDLIGLEKEYEQKHEELKSLDIVKSPYWESARQAQLRELEQVYQLRKTEMRAYSDPVALREYTAAPACNIKYAEPLIAGGEPLLNVWRELNIESRKRNADPEGRRKRFEAELASTDRLKFALVEVLTFGWGNCANLTVDYYEAGNDGTAQAEFKKLFKRVKTIYCEEP